MINLKPQGFGLKIPPNLKENKTRYINNMMNKNKITIRLTESDLHRMVSEAVKSVLTELDARTYASAADKATDRLQGRRAQNFRMAAVDAWNRDYGKNISPFIDGVNNDGSGSSTQMYYDDYDVYTNDNDKIGKHMHYMPYNNTKTGNETWHDDSVIGKRVSKSELKKNPGWNVARQMSKGNGKYIPGKGWE